jgi:hypothetical protein
VDRVVKAKKFEATLKPRLDNAIEDWHKEQPSSITPPVIDLDNLRIRAPWANDGEQKP